MLKKFAIENYKNLQFKDGLMFNPKLNIFIGPNNSGKSNLIDGMNFWADLLKVGFQQSLLKRNFRAILNRYNKEDSVYLAWTINTGGKFPDLLSTRSYIFRQYCRGKHRGLPLPYRKICE